MITGDQLVALLMMGKEEMQYRSTQVVIAALNEAQGIGPTILDLLEHLGSPRILVVDGKSHDRTVEIAKEMNAEIIQQDGFGKGDAISKALKHLDLNADYVVFIDADYTYPAEYLPEMIRILEEDPQVGMVCGDRFNGRVDPKALQNLFYFGNRLIAWTHNLLNGVYLNDPLTGLRVVRTEILEEWNVKSKSFDVEVELNYHVEGKGSSIVEVPIRYRQRLGEKKLKIKHGVTILKRIILDAFSFYSSKTLNPKQKIMRRV